VNQLIAIGIGPTQALLQNSRHFLPSIQTGPTAGTPRNLHKFQCLRLSVLIEQALWTNHTTAAGLIPLAAPCERHRIAACGSLALLLTA